MNLPPRDLDQTPAQAEALLDRLLAEREHGITTDDGLRRMLPRLRWRDERGGRYTLGVNSRSWFAWDGTGWVPGVPPPTLRIDLDPEPEPVVDPMSPLETTTAAPTDAAVAGWVPTHRVPAQGMPAWTSPDPASASTPLDPGLPVQVVEGWGDWSRIVCSNGWGAWVDGRLLAPL